MSKTIIYFFRHGEVYNPKRILYGRLPGFPLSETGKKMIKETVEQFKDKKILHIYTSPMLRARQTADIISKTLRITSKISRFLIETDDIFAGVPLDIFKSKIQPKLYDKTFVRIGQESAKSQARRMLKFLKQVTKCHNGESTIAVSHGDPIVILKAATLDIPFTWDYKKGNYLKQGSWLKFTVEENRYSWE